MWQGFCTRTANVMQWRTLPASGNEGKPCVGDLQILQAAMGMQGCAGPSQQCKAPLGTKDQFQGMLMFDDI